MRRKRGPRTAFTLCAVVSLFVSTLSACDGCTKRQTNEPSSNTPAPTSLIRSAPTNWGEGFFPQEILEIDCGILPGRIKRLQFMGVESFHPRTSRGSLSYRLSRLPEFGPAKSIEIQKTTDGWEMAIFEEICPEPAATCRRISAALISDESAQQLRKCLFDLGLNNTFTCTRPSILDETLLIAEIAGDEGYVLKAWYGDNEQAGVASCFRAIRFIEER